MMKAYLNLQCQPTAALIINHGAAESPAASRLTEEGEPRLTEEGVVREIEVE